MKIKKPALGIGLDIGTSTIKLVKLKFIGETVELCGFNLESTQTGLEPVTVIRKIAQSQHVKRVNISASGSATIIRYVNFPRMKEEELKQALKFEAQKHIPFSMAEVNLDGYILKEDLPDNKMLVLLAAVKKEFINQRLKLIEDAGLKVNVVDMDSLALLNAFNFNYADDNNIKTKTIAMLNIGASISNLNILEGSIPCLSRDIHIAGNNFTQKLMDIFGIDFKSAEELKINPDKERVDKITSAVESVLSNLATELRNSFDYYESHSASTVVKIFLSGERSQVSGLKDMLANLLGIEVEYWDPLRRINISSNIETQKIKTLSLQLAVAIGLALRGA